MDREERDIVLEVEAQTRKLPAVLRHHYQDDDWRLAVLTGITAPLHTLRSVLKEKFYEQHAMQFAEQHARFANKGRLIEASATGLVGMMNDARLGSDDCMTQMQGLLGLHNKQEALTGVRNYITTAQQSRNGNLSQSRRLDDMQEQNTIVAAFGTTWDTINLAPTTEPILYHPYHQKFALPAFLITAVLQGTVMYLASYGLQQMFAATVADAITGAICHGVSTTLIGLWLGSGRGYSGIASGLLVGLSAYLIQAHVLPELAQLLGCPISAAEVQILGYGLTVLSTLLWESISCITSYGPETYGRGPELYFEAEFYLHQHALSSFQHKCKPGYEVLSEEPVQHVDRVSEDEVRELQL